MFLISWDTSYEQTHLGVTPHKISFTVDNGDMFRLGLRSGEIIESFYYPTPLCYSYWVENRISCLKLHLCLSESPFLLICQMFCSSFLPSGSTRALGLKMSTQLSPSIDAIIGTQTNDLSWRMAVIKSKGPYQIILQLSVNKKRNITETRKC